MDRSLSPREAAEKLGISQDTLRRWEKNGLIQPERTPGGQRRYNEEDISAMLDQAERPSSRQPVMRPELRRLSGDAESETLPARGTTPQVPAWERRIKEEQADLEIIKIRSERAALIRAERSEREKRERMAQEAQRTSAAREAEVQRNAAREATQNKRLDDLRSYGRMCAVWAPPEYQAKVVRDLLSSVNIGDYPPDMPDYLSRVQVNARVEELLNPWKDGQARDRTRIEEAHKRDSLVLSGRYYAQSETLSWEPAEAARAKRAVERALKDEVEPDWTKGEVRDLVDDVLDEWEDD